MLRDNLPPAEGMLGIPVFVVALEPAALLVVLFGNQCSLSFQGFLSCGSPRRCRRGGTWGTRVPPVRRGAGPSGCSTRAGADNMRYRARPVHAHHGTTVRGRRFGHPPGMGRAPRRMPRGPERGEGMGGGSADGAELTRLAVVLIAVIFFPTVVGASGGTRGRCPGRAATRCGRVAGITVAGVAGVA